MVILMDGFKGTGEMPLYERVIKGGAWVFFVRAIQQTLYFARLVVLARLISPKDFGLFGVALLVLSMLDTFSETGFGHALIQRKGETRPYLDTIWTVSMIRGALIAAALFFLAPWFSLFFKTPQMTPIIRTVGLATFFQGLTNVTVIYFEKELKFHKYFIYHVTGAIVDLTVAVSAALILRNAWALVMGCLAGNIARCAVSYIIDPYRPGLRFDLAKARELSGFGKWIFGICILNFFLVQGDDLFVGRVLGVTALGFYQMAYFISNLPATEFSGMISQVTFPAYSIIQDNVSRLRAAYIPVLKLTAMLAFPLSGIIFLLAPDFVRIFLTETWLPIVVPLKILAVYGLFRSIGATMGPLFLAVGKPEISTKVKTVQLAILIICIYPLSRSLGISGTALAVLAYMLPTTIFVMKKGFDILELDRREAIKVMSVYLAVTAAALLVAYGVKKAALNSMEAASFIMVFILFVLTYGALLALIKKVWKYQTFPLTLKIGNT